MTEEELALLMERNEQRKRMKSHEFISYHAVSAHRQQVHSDIDQLLALVADLQSALLEFTES